ncbi:MAG TPA: ribosome biogenesis GTPase YlqF [Gammaproteobacteria bacterium]|nr:ribosome biogenesis GTPase YlqF [Gammaproteobacteria bacterium]
MIQWYPGHMHKAGKELRKILPQVDLVIEVLDARLPGSSENPLLTELRGDKPCLMLLNKSDLADTEILKSWIDALRRRDGIETLACSSEDNAVERVPALCRELIARRDNRSAMVYALIAGIPNVGKSTLINRLAKRKIARTGNEAAVTRMQQRIEISPELTLIDTPGMLWPRIDNEASGYRLAATGAIRETALDLQSVADFTAEFLLDTYPERVLRRYDIDALPGTGIELLEAIARRRGCLVGGGQVDLEKVSRLLIGELRAGELGGICLETPSGFVVESRQAALKRAEKEAAAAARKKMRRK